MGFKIQSLIKKKIMFLTGQNAAKQGQTRPNMIKRGQTGLKRAKGSQWGKVIRAQKGAKRNEKGHK